MSALTMFAAHLVGIFGQSGERQIEVVAEGAVEALGAVVLLEQLLERLVGGGQVVDGADDGEGDQRQQQVLGEVVERALLDTGHLGVL